MQLVYLDKLLAPIECDEGEIFIETKNHRCHGNAEDRVWLARGPKHALCIYVSLRRQSAPPIKVVKIQQVRTGGRNV